MEMMVATASLMVMSAGIVGVTSLAQSSLATNAKVHTAHVAGARALDRLQRFVRGSSWSTEFATVAGVQEPQTLDDLAELGFAGPYDNLTFRSFLVNPDDPNAMPVLSEPFRIYLQDDPTEPPNGVDDDGDGVVDERHLVLDAPDADPLVISGGVVSFQVRPENRTLHFDVTTATSPIRGSTVSQTTTLSVEIRND